MSERLKTAVLNLSYQQGLSLEELARLLRQPKAGMRDTLSELVDEQRLHECHGRRITTYHTTYLSGAACSNTASETQDEH